MHKGLCRCAQYYRLERNDSELHFHKVIEIGLCTEGCGYYKIGEIAALGDCDGNQEITISDVVMLLRLLNGGVSIDAVDCVAGNVYKEDGYTANGGITTADALMLMKYVLK